MVKEKTIRDVSVLERRIKLQRKHTIKIIKKSMQEPDSEVKFGKTSDLELILELHRSYHLNPRPARAQPLSKFTYTS